MNKKKQEALEQAGWVIGDIETFLGNLPFTVLHAQGTVLRLVKLRAETPKAAADKVHRGVGSKGKVLLVFYGHINMLYVDDDVFEFDSTDWYKTKMKEKPTKAREPKKPDRRADTRRRNDKRKEALKGNR